MPFMRGENSSTQLQIRLLGPFEVQIDGQAVTHIHSRKEQWLLALLALRNGKEIPRTQLAWKLWPDSTEEQALAYLRRSLYLLKQALGVEAERLQGLAPRSLRLDLSEAFVDVLAFDAALKQQDTALLEAAVGLYRGTLLEGCEEEWVLLERSEREQGYLQALEMLGERALSAGKAGEAVGYLRRLAERDSLRESGHRLLMQALAASGDYGAMLVAYRELRLLLRQEVNADPSPETVHLFETLRAQSQQSVPLKRTEPATSAPVAAPNEAVSTPMARGRIPHPLTSLTGRTELVREALGCLATARLVTLSGTGGVGKTRVAIEIARERSEVEEVWFIELAALTSPADVPHMVAKALGITEERDVSPEELLARALTTRNVLLVLDNCEHLVTACAELCASLLRSCPRLHILTTSRQSLGVLGEVTLVVPPLELPPLPVLKAGENDALDKGLLSILMEYEAIQLFVKRAQAVSPRFLLTTQNALAVIQICRHLEGIPLALELAAARVKSLSVEQLLERLNRRFRLLTEGNRGALPHHQTLRALIDWSYDLLTEPEKTLLNRLTVFSGGWTLELAEKVCEEDVLDLLTSLVDKSLVQVNRADAEARYSLLETIREYAAEKLEVSGERSVWCSRHCSCYMLLMSDISPRLRSTSQKELLDQIEREYDNMRAAMQWSFTEEPPETMMRLCGSLVYWWQLRGDYYEGRSWCEKALSRSTPQEKTKVKADLLRAYGTLAWLQGDYAEAYRLHVEALAIRRLLGNKKDIADSLQNLGITCSEMGEYAEARQYQEEALPLLREIGDQSLVANLLNNLAHVVMAQGDYQAGRPLLEESLALSEAHAGKLNSAMPLLNLAVIALSDKDYAQASLLAERSLDIWREFGARRGAALALGDLSDIALAQGDHERARQYQRESLETWRELGVKQGIASSLESFALLALREAQTMPEASSRYPLSARLFGSAALLRKSIKSSLSPEEQAKVDASHLEVREALGEAAFTSAWEEGGALSLEQAIDLALDYANEGITTLP